MTSNYLKALKLDIKISQTDGFIKDLLVELNDAIEGLENDESSLNSNQFLTGSQNTALEAITELKEYFQQLIEEYKLWI